MPQETPPGYVPEGTVTVTLRFTSGPFSVRGSLLRHEPCGSLVADGWTARHESRCRPEAGEAA